MNVIAFPRAERREIQLRGIEQCLEALYTEADQMGLEMLAHMIAVARESAFEALNEESRR